MGNLDIGRLFNRLSENNVGEYKIFHNSCMKNFDSVEMSLLQQGHWSIGGIK